MIKLDFEKAEEPEIKLPTSIGSLKKQESSRKKSTSALLIMPKPLTVWIKTKCGKFFKIWKYQTTWPPEKSVCRSRRKVRSGHGRRNWLQIVKSILQGCILSPCLFNLYEEYIMWNARLDKAQVGIKITERNINSLRYGDDTTFMAESKEEIKSLFMKVKEESEKVVLKLSI